MKDQENGTKTQLTSIYLTALPQDLPSAVLGSPHGSHNWCLDQMNFYEQISIYLEHLLAQNPSRSPKEAARFHPSSAKAGSKSHHAFLPRIRNMTPPNPSSCQTQSLGGRIQTLNRGFEKDCKSILRIKETCIAMSKRNIKMRGDISDLFPRNVTPTLSPHLENAILTAGFSCQLREREGL